MLSYISKEKVEFLTQKKKHRPLPIVEASLTTHEGEPLSCKAVQYPSAYIITPNSAYCQVI